jgi:hypothetical protein
MTLTDTDPDRMAPLGTLPHLDFSTGTPARDDREAYRDYDTVILPAAQLDLDGIDAARTLLDKAERGITEYKAEGDSLNGDITAVSRARAGLAGKHLGRALDSLRQARSLIDDTCDEDAGRLSDADSDALFRLRRQLPDLARVHALRKLCEEIAGTETAPEEAGQDDAGTEVDGDCPESKMSDGSHDSDFSGGGRCSWCGDLGPLDDGNEVSHG